MEWLKSWFGKKDDGPGAILVVDDESDIRKLLQLHLGAVGARVEAARDAQHARKEIEKSGPFCLFVLDVMMEGEDGISLARWIRQRPETADVPILILTGVLEDSTLQKLEAEMPKLYTMQKPFDSPALRRFVGDILKRHLEETASSAE